MCVCVWGGGSSCLRRSCPGSCPRSGCPKGGIRPRGWLPSGVVILGGICPRGWFFPRGGYPGWLSRG